MSAYDDIACLSIREDGVFIGYIISLDPVDDVLTMASRWYKYNIPHCKCELEPIHFDDIDFNLLLYLHDGEDINNGRKIENGEELKEELLIRHLAGLI